MHMIGARLGPWLLDREIGRGGMASVYLAHADPPPADGPRTAAVKVLAAELAAEQGFLLRFQREIDIVRQLDHPNIIRFFESGVEGGRPWFAMEYVAGPSFDAVLEARGRLPWREVLDLACQIAPALKHAHDRGVVHRDLKPSNILRGPQPRGEGREDGAGVAKLGDFGVASIFAGRHLTVTGGVVGTAEFLSPEQAAGKPVTRRSDLYSLGAVLYTLLTGRPPFDGEIVDLLHKHQFAQFDAPIRIVPEMPRDLSDVICELLEKDPEKRPADGAVLFRRLDGIRRKVQRLDSALTTATVGGFADAEDTEDESGDKAGPATLMSRLMRRELERQNRGGPVRRFFNRPWVLLALLAIVIGAIVWTMWPVSEEQLYQSGAAAAASSNPDDWDKAQEVFDALDRDHPNHAHRAEVNEFRQGLAARQAAQQAAQATQQAARKAGPMSEAQWFFQEGMRLRQRGDLDGARRTWQALTRAFGQTPSEAPWVRLAERELARLEEAENADPMGDRQWGPVREAVQRAKQLRAEGKADEAEAILQGLRDLYRGDPEAEKIIKE
jgi:eukaryotic-like serine/threonine-protein kinase